ncbi:hypothetical protein [Bradyrhizobium canariense]|uniref:hypothetical protein n=1 Tax=Bradyrhizobium canariense TaxID=255045 RepID=UPI001B8A08A7|nr:hypothetical protein [Bradyrhizobium canariense]MBR0949599.1 hypothetical protein [Bradyrhizobium canariense]
MQCAPIAASVFALRQAFAGFASGKILKEFVEHRVGDTKDATARDVSRVGRKSFACSIAFIANGLLSRIVVD